jgi:hypothetical protein
MKAFKFAGNSLLPRGVRSAVVAGAVVAGTLVGAGVADAAPAPNQQGNYQTCVTQGIANAINVSRSVPPLQRGTFLANQIARVTRDCRNRYPNSTYIRSASQTATRGRDGVNSISVRCDAGDKLVGHTFVTVRGNVRNIVSERVTNRPDGYFVSYRYNRVPTEVKLTITCRRF